MVPSSVSPGNVKLQVVMLLNVITGQLFLGGHRFVPNARGKEGSRKHLCIEWLFLSFSIKKSVFQGISGHPLHLGRILCFAWADNKIHDVQACTTFIICIISITEANSWSKTGINSCLVQNCNHTVMFQELTVVQVSWILQISQTGNPTSPSSTSRSNCKHAIKR